MTPVALIPARAGSKRCPGKNRRPLGGVPLWQWAYYCAEASERFARIYLFTDDDEVRAQAERDLAGRALHVTHRRPSRDGQTTDDAILEWAAEAACPLPHFRDWTSLVLLQPTSPFRSPLDVGFAVDVLENGMADSVFSTTANMSNGGIYGVRRDAWNHGHRLTCGRIYALGTEHPGDIDTEDDFAKAERKVHAGWWANWLPGRNA